MIVQQTSIHIIINYPETNYPEKNVSNENEMILQQTSIQMSSREMQETRGTFCRTWAISGKNVNNANKQKQTNNATNTIATRRKTAECQQCQQTTTNEQCQQTLLQQGERLSTNKCTWYNKRNNVDNANKQIHQRNKWKDM